MTLNHERNADTMLRYNPKLKPIARTLRKKMTDSERVLWSRLRAKQICGVQFYRQKPIGSYVVDFYGPRAKLVIEIDGSQHRQQDAMAADQRRDAFLAQAGLTVLRFNSREVLTETDAVVAVVHRAVLERIGV